MSLKRHRRWIWDKSETAFYQGKLEGLVLHVCCGESLVGDVRIDIEAQEPHPRDFILADYRHLPIRDKAFTSVICDPKWGKTERVDEGIIQWLSELRRVSNKKVVIVHNTIFNFPGLTLEKCWAVRAKGLLYKSLSLYSVMKGLEHFKDMSLRGLP